MIGGKVSQSSAAITRFGRDLDPVWHYGPTYSSPITASWVPPAWSFTSLITVPVSTEKSSYIYGYYITTEEPNIFWIAWWRQGTLYYNSVDVPMGGTITSSLDKIISIFAMNLSVFSIFRSHLID